MTDNLLYQRRRNIFCGKHRYAGVPTIVWLMGTAYQLHNRRPVGVVVVSVIKVCAVGSVEQVLKPVIIPFSKERVSLVCDRNYSY